MQHLLAIAVVIIVCTIALLVRAVGFDGTKSVSLHAAINRTLWLPYAMGMTLAAALVVAHCFIWLSAADNSVFLTGLAILSISTVVAVWVRDRQGWERRIHYMAVYGVLASTPLVTIGLISAPSTTTQLVATSSLLLQLGIMYLYFFVVRARAHVFIFQGIYLGSLLTSLLAATYL